MKIALLLFLLLAAPRLLAQAVPGRFQLLSFTNSLMGQSETGVLRLDSATGETWLFESSYQTNGAYLAAWVPVPVSPISNLEANQSAAPASPPASSATKTSVSR